MRKGTIQKDRQGTMAWGTRNELGKLCSHPNCCLDGWVSKGWRWARRPSDYQISRVLPMYILCVPLLKENNIWRRNSNNYLIKLYTVIRRQKEITRYAQYVQHSAK